MSKTLETTKTGQDLLEIYNNQCSVESSNSIRNEGHWEHFDDGHLDRYTPPPRYQDR